MHSDSSPKLKATKQVRRFRTLLIESLEQRRVLAVDFNALGARQVESSRQAEFIPEDFAASWTWSATQSGVSENASIGLRGEGEPGFGPIVPPGSGSGSGVAEGQPGLGSEDDPNLEFPDECTLRAAIEEANSWSGKYISFANGALADIVGANFVVNSNRDGGDNKVGDGVCWTGDKYTSDVSLIQPLSELTPLLSPMTIRGHVNDLIPGDSSTYLTPKTEIRGDLAGSANGFVMEGSSSSISHLAITKFSQNGVKILGSSNDISGNFIGTNRAGNAASPNALNGVRIEGGNNNTIGTSQWNVISANGKNGVSIQSGADNYVAQNYIGTDRWGEFSLGTQLYGVEIEPTAGSNIVGGADLMVCNLFKGYSKQDPCANVISGNKLDGVKISGSSPAGSKVTWSRIGTDRDGIKAVENNQNGVRIEGTPNVEVVQNLISGNKENGLLLDNAINAIVSGNRIGPNLWATAGLLDSKQKEGVLAVRGSSGAFIDGNVVSGNKLNGIHLTGTGSSSARISNNNIGMDNLGEVAIANDEEGILIDGNSSDHFIGFHNLISGNKRNGIRINGGSGTRIQGNLIGTNLASQASRPNLRNGILIEGNASELIIGFDDLPPENSLSLFGARNIIAGNDGSGVYLDSNVSKVRIAGNDIGFEATIPFGNGKDGITVLGPNNLIGTDGDDAEDDREGNNIKYNGENGVHFKGGSATAGMISGNWISKNVVSGVFIENAPQNKVGQLGKGKNFIWSNSIAGIDISGSGSVGNVIDGNIIGTEPDGKTVPTKSQQVGVRVRLSAQSNRIGVARAQMSFWTQSNLISANTDAGILISDASFNYVVSNKIGLAIDSSIISGQSNGVRIERGSLNVIGQTEEAGYNVISGNEEEGVLVTGLGSDANTIKGNHLGTDWLIDLDNPKPNKIGVRISGSASNQVVENAILFNKEKGVVLESSSSLNTINLNRIWNNDTGGVLITSNSSENTLTHNIISRNGTYLGSGVGVTINGGATKNYVGKISLGNTINENDENGVLIEGADENEIVANEIVGNFKMGGVRIVNGNRNQIGAPGSAANSDYKNAAFGNTIQRNRGGGVLIESGTRNPIRLNNIYENTGLGIDLGADGVTRNDVGDIDPGANELQNFPVIRHRSAIDTDFNKVTISLNGKPNTNYLIDLYYVPVRDNSNFGEGKELIRAGIEAKTNEAGSFKRDDIVVDSKYIRNQIDSYHLTSTATDPDGNTSEFSGRELRIFYGIDGTGSGAWLGEADGCSKTYSDRWNSHTRNLYEEFRETIEFANYARGPAAFKTAHDAFKLKQDALDYILSSIQKTSEMGEPNPPIALAGWSRGAQIALWVANELGRRGHIVDLVGLYDPVDMSPYIPNAERIVDQRIKQVQMFGPKQTSFSAPVWNQADSRLPDFFSFGFGKYDDLPTKNADWRFFVRASHRDLTVTGQIKFGTTVEYLQGIHLPNGSKTILNGELKKDATHGAIGGTPGFNDDNSFLKGSSMWGEDNPNDPATTHTGWGNQDYDYPLDVQNSILADRHIRQGLKDQGWFTKDLSDKQYGFPATNPSVSACSGGSAPSANRGGSSSGGNSSGGNSSEDEPESEGAAALMAPIALENRLVLNFVKIQEPTTFANTSTNSVVVPTSPFVRYDGMSTLNLGQSSSSVSTPNKFVSFKTSVNSPLVGLVPSLLLDSAVELNPNLGITQGSDLEPGQTKDPQIDSRSTKRSVPPDQSPRSYLDEVWSEKTFVLNDSFYITLKDEDEGCVAPILTLGKWRKNVSKQR